MIDSVLYGNGFNQLCDKNPSWDKLLEYAAQSTVDIKKGVTPTLQYEFSFLDYLFQLKEKDTVSRAEFRYKSRLAECLSDLDHHYLYDELRRCGVSLFLTTNYDYNILPRNEIDWKTMAQDKSESVYSIHRWYKTEIDNKEIVIYPFHGEIRRPKTIELGFDHYCGSIGKIDRYVKGTYEFSSAPGECPLSILRRLDNDKIYKLSEFRQSDHGIPNILSWIDAFFFTNLHIIGFGLNFSEIDIWWLLDRRARIAAEPLSRINNKIYYYSTDIPSKYTDVIKSKHKLLEKYGVEVVEMSGGSYNDYVDVYKEQLKNLKDRLSI